MTTFQEICDVIGTSLVQNRLLALIQATAVVVDVVVPSIDLTAVHEEVDP